MPRIAYVNGAYLPLAQAGVSIEDRGFQFADAAYEVIGVRGGRLLDRDGHFARLEQSLGAIGMTQSLSVRALDHVIRETLRRNRVTDALVYLQLTRGAAARDHAFPLQPSRPASLIVVAKPFSWAAAETRSATGIAVITLPDPRWKRCDIKSTGLLPNVLAKQAAKEAGAAEAWFVDERGFVTEGASSNAWIVTGEGRVVTRPLGHAILPGITRHRFLGILARQGLAAEERAFTVEETFSAREAFISGATNIATAVIKIDGKPVGDGKPGGVSRLLRGLYWQCSN